MTSSPAPLSLTELLSRNLSEERERRVFLYDRRGKTSESRSYPELLSAARRTAACLAARGLEERDRVLVLLPTSWAGLEAWLGSLFRGAWPAMVASGGATDLAAQNHRIDELVEQLEPRLLVCDSAMKAQLLRGGAPRAARTVVSAAELSATPAIQELAEARPQPCETAFLQLTSGATGRPRAVRISHAGAVHNPRAIAEAVSAPDGAPISSADAGVVSWLPLYHDMGLVGCLLFALAHRLDLRLMRPETFLARPLAWLKALAETRGALTAAPNFAYQFCVERLAEAELEGLDLSRWRAALTGGEMIRPETAAVFLACFGARGLAAGTQRPAYGLAEATLAVAVDRRGAGVRTRPLPSGYDAGLGLKEAVCVGAPISGTEVRISAPDGARLPEGVIGAVQVQGPSVMQGYFNDPEATAETLRDGWLDTGDLGFFHAGELHLAGRSKELLILQGHNRMPHELEWAAERASGGGGSVRCGAFSIARGPKGEEAVLIVEAARTTPDWLAGTERAIRLRVAKELGLPLADLLFVRRGALPRTTSGKVRRLELRRRYLEGKLERLPG